MEQMRTNAICPECGKAMHERSLIQECERCLSKKQD